MAYKIKNDDEWASGLNILNARIIADINNVSI